MWPEVQPSNSSQNFWVLFCKKKQELQLMERNLRDAWMQTEQNEMN